MSLVLGPIHNWLYGKVLFQNALNQRMIALAEKEGWIVEGVNVKRYGELEPGALADIIEGDNIHGWLQARVDLVENTLAYLVTVFAEAHTDALEKILEAANAFGKERGAGDLGDAIATYQYLDSLLLNGMPCDRVNEVVLQESDRVVWRQVVDIHAQYWKAVGGDSTNYEKIREQVIKGVLDGSEFTFHINDEGEYEIAK